MFICGHGCDKGHSQEYEVIKVTADSGAADHVAPLNVAKYIELVETEASRQGIKYVAANGHKITNVGQRKIQGTTDEGVPLGITWQVADIKKPLASIGRMCDAGNVALFTCQGGFVVPEKAVADTLRKLENRGSALRMKRDNGVYSFNMRVAKPSCAAVGESRREVRESLLLGNRFAALQESETGFHRLGRHLE